MNYYSVLGVTISSTQDEIKKAYRKLAKEFHPDRNKTKEAEDKFKKINEAYETLSDKSKRMKYDSPSPYGRSFSGFNKSNMDITDLFSQAFEGFNGIKKRNVKQKKTFTSENTLIINISFEESVNGLDKKILKHTYKTECISCNGYGGKYIVCDSCNGKGTITKADGFVSINITCNECNGVGNKKVGSCVECHDKGYIEISEEIDFKIPEGMEERTQLLVRGKGHKINGKRGDLFVSVIVDEKSGFERVKNDIIQTISVNVLDILKENIILVKTLKDDIEINLSKSYHGREFIFKHKGTKTVHGQSYGDLIIKIDTYFPELDKKQKQIIKSI